MTAYELFSKYKLDVFRTCYYMLGHKEDAEDLTQDVFLKAMEEDFERIENLKAWLIKISINLCRNELKRRKVRKTKEHTLLLTKKLFEGNTGEIEVTEKELQSELNKLLQSVPEKVRIIIILKYLHHLKHEEIAKILNIPVSTVKTRCYRGLKTLKKSIENDKTFKQWREMNVSKS